MSIENSRYGRHVSKLNKSATTSSLTVQSKLVQLLNEMKPKIKKLTNANVAMSHCTSLIQLFYTKSTHLIDSSLINSPLKEAKLNMLFILFCAMFDIKMPKHDYILLENDLKQLLILYNKQYYQ